MWELRGGKGWESGPVVVAASGWRRLRGLLPTSDHGLLLRATSVHGVGMTHPVWAIGLDGRVVIGVVVLAVGAFRRHPRATAILELPLWRDPPELGDRLVVRRIR